MPYPGAPSRGIKGSLGEDATEMSAGCNRAAQRIDLTQASSGHIRMTSGVDAFHCTHIQQGK